MFLQVLAFVTRGLDRFPSREPGKIRLLKRGIYFVGKVGDDDFVMLLVC
jgi:hypothetical protein